MSVFLRESLKLDWAVISLWDHKVIFCSFQMVSNKGSGVISALGNNHPGATTNVYIFF